MRRRVAVTLAGAIISAFLLTMAGAAAAPPTITETFHSGSDGWEIYENGTGSPAEWIPAGGNPGGFIRYEDADAASADALFADSDYVSNISRREGQTIVVDLRAGEPRTDGPTVYLGDPYYPQYPMIHLERGASLSAGWVHYEFPLSSNRAHRWRDEAGEPLTHEDFRAFLATDPAIYFRADYSVESGESTDFDNVGIVMFIPRNLTLRFKRSRDDEFYGRLKSPNDACEPNVEVRVYRKAHGKRKLIGSKMTNGSGRYGLSDAGKPGKYVAKVDETELGSPLDVCAPAKSNRVKID